MKRSMQGGGNFTRCATGFGMALLGVLWAGPATPTETPASGEADVFLTKIHVPKGVKTQAGGGAASRNITVKGGGDAMTQEATVRLKATPGGGVKVAVTPGSIMAMVGPQGGAPTLRFNAEIARASVVRRAHPGRSGGLRPSVRRETAIPATTRWRAART